jgi:hypothetical protein
MRVSNTALGSPEAVSLVDQIHILALAYVFVAAVMAVARSLRARYASPYTWRFWGLSSTRRHVPRAPSRTSANQISVSLASTSSGSPR